MTAGTDTAVPRAKAPEPDFTVRKSWQNHLGNQSIDPLRIYEPQTIEEVVVIVRAAEDAGVTVRAVGSGHSWSDVALTPGFLVEPQLRVFEC